MDIFKDVLIQNLGYHSIERIPKTITTSEINIYSTFYNYLLEGFTIVRLPKMIFDSKEKRYKKFELNDCYLRDSELILKDEIQAIRKLIPKNEIQNYYR